MVFFHRREKSLKLNAQHLTLNAERLTLNALLILKTLYFYYFMVNGNKKKSTHVL